MLAQWLNNRRKIVSSRVQILPITIVQKTMVKETFVIILLCFVSIVVEQSTQNHKIEGLNPANDPGNWKGLDLVTYKKKMVFFSTVVEQLTQNCKFEGSNPANDLGNWKGLD